MIENAPKVSDLFFWLTTKNYTKCHEIRLFWKILYYLVFKFKPGCYISHISWIKQFVDFIETSLESFGKSDGTGVRTRPVGSYGEQDVVRLWVVWAAVAIGHNWAVAHEAALHWGWYLASW